MHKTTITGLVAAAFALTVGVNATFANQTAPAGAPTAAVAGHGQHGKLIKELGLTKDQRAQFKTIRANFKTQADAIKNDSSLSEADKKAKLKDLRKQMRSQVEAILTPEQREKLKQLRQERREARENGKDHHGVDAD